jgi:nicotinamidase-related amidase
MKKPPYTLLVIDMQDYFLTSWHDDERNELVKSVKEEIITAMGDSAPVVLVEYTGCGKTATSLLDIVDYYPDTHLIRKDSNGGGKKLAQYVQRNGLPTEIRVVGINTDYCVLESVRNLAKQLPDPGIEVIAKACNSPYNHENGLKRLRNIANVKVV